MRKIFIFEDDLKRIHKFKHALRHNSYVVITDEIEEAKNILQKDVFDIAFLDHDMDSVSERNEDSLRNNGFQLASWIVQEQITFDMVIVHSHNPEPAQKMTDLLHKFGDSIKNIHRVPFQDLIALLEFADEGEEID